jgi:cytochrome c553
MFDFVGVGLLVILLIIFGALTVRALRAQRTWVKLVGGIGAGLLTLVFGATTTAALVGFYRLNAVRPNPAQTFTVVSTPERIARGEKFTRICAGCHSANGQQPLTGQDFMEGAPFGTFYAPNLTQTNLGDWSDGEIARAIREGVHKNGRSLLIMPSNAFHAMSDEDVQAVIAYLRSQPTDAPNTPPNAFNVIGAIMFGALDNSAQTAQPPITGPVAAPPEGTTPAYGGYLLRVSGCRDCHGESLAGGVRPDTGEQTPSLINVGTTWSEADFIKAIRTGVKPDGTQLSEGMPWKEFEKLSEDNLRAMYRHLQSLK